MSEESKTDWKENLSEELRGHKTLADVKDIDGLAQQFIDSQQMIGQSIRIPGPEAGDDAWKAFHGKLVDKVPNLIPTPDPDDKEAMTALYNRMGRPEAPEGYEHPEGVDPTTLKDFATAAHELGLTKSQYKGLVDKLSQAGAAKDEKANTDQEQGLRDLKREWGIVYEDNLKMVDSVLKKTDAPQSWKEMAADQKLPPDALKWLYNIGKQLGEEGINWEKDETSTRVPPAEAKARIAEIMGDTDGPYWDASHPQHRDYINRVVELQKAANSV